MTQFADSVRWAEAIVDALGGRGDGQGGYMALCPAHADRNPSLHLTPTADTLLLHCMAGCENAAVIAALRERSLWEEPPAQPASAGATNRSARPRAAARAVKAQEPRGRGARAPAEKPVVRPRDPLGPIEETYLYLDEEGRPRTRTLRHEGKQFRQEAYFDAGPDGCPPKQDGQKRSCCRNGPPAGPVWHKYVPDHLRILYRLPQLRQLKPGDLVIVTEGEKDAETVAALGLAVTTAPMGLDWDVSYSEELRGLDVVVLGDNDEPGRAGATKRARSLDGLAARLRVLVFTELAAHGDVTDWFEAGHTREELLARIRRTPLWADPDVPQLAVLDSFEDVQVEPVDWLWAPYIARGAITLLEGDPGLGKSVLTTVIAAALSRSWALPGQAQQDDARKTRRVLMLAGEDSPGTTIRPRLEALGANLRMIRPVVGLLMNDETIPMTLSSDGLDALERHIDKWQPAVVMIDPLLNYVDGIDVNKAAEVRPLMRRLRDMAESRNIAVLALRHQTKMAGGNPLHRGQGSIDFTAVARSVLAVNRDPDREERIVMLQIKNNLEALGPGLAFFIGSGHRGIDFHWDSEPVTLTADDLFAPKDAFESKTALQEAVNFLRHELHEAPVRANEVRTRADKANIADRTLRRAKDRLKVASIRQDNEWVWALPLATLPNVATLPGGQNGRQNANEINMANLGNVANPPPPEGPQTFLDRTAPKDDDDDTGVY